MTPLVLSVFAIHLLYTAIDQKLMRFIDKFIGFSFPGLGILLLLATVYLMGLITSNLVGRQILNLIDKIAMNIPIVGTTQKIGQQIVGMLSLPEKQVFQKAVLIPYLKPGIWALGFVTGNVFDETSNETLLKVFVPTPPNPLSGTMVLIGTQDIKDPGWTVDEAIKTIISGGIIGPETIKSKNLNTVIDPQPKGVTE